MSAATTHKYMFGIAWLFTPVIMPVLVFIAHVSRECDGEDKEKAAIQAADCIQATRVLEEKTLSTILYLV